MWLYWLCGGPCITRVVNNMAPLILRGVALVGVGVTVTLMVLVGVALVGVAIMGVVKIACGFVCREQKWLEETRLLEVALQDKIKEATTNREKEEPSNRCEFTFFWGGGGGGVDFGGVGQEEMTESRERLWRREGGESHFHCLGGRIREGLLRGGGGGGGGEKEGVKRGRGAGAVVNVILSLRGFSTLGKLFS